ncbi:MAG: hypothetical protein RIC80_15105 [Cyclobacteriaceae bacterium]
MALTDLTKKTKEELAGRINDLERLISKKGIGSSYVSKVEKIQRRVNIVFFLGAITAVAGLFTWLSLRGGDEDDA